MKVNPICDGPKLSKRPARIQLSISMLTKCLLEKGFLPCISVSWPRDAFAIAVVLVPANERPGLLV